MKISTLANTFLYSGICLFVATACGGGQTEAAAPEGEAASTEQAAGDAEAAEKFDDMAPAARLKFMKEVVAPAMTTTFQAYDAEAYAEFSCATCHGPGAKDGNFAMPTADLPKLPQDVMQVKEAKPEVFAFMYEKVVPEMAAMLGEDVYNPETQQGFGCFACHMQAD